MKRILLSIIVALVAVASVSAQAADFIRTGATLYWTASTFTIEQRNDKNTAAGITKMNGEVKGGKFYIYNRQWDETWIGTLANGVISGKINNNYTFQIFE